VSPTVLDPTTPAPTLAARHPPCAPTPTTDPHLRAWAREVTATATAITTATHTWTPATAPGWARPYLADTSPDHRDLLAELAIWRAGHHVPDADQRPTGPTVYPTVERRHQQTLDHQAAHHITIHHTNADHRPDADHWTALARRLDARLLADPYWPVLAGHLTNPAAGAAGAADIQAWLRHTLESKPLPTARRRPALATGPPPRPTPPRHRPDHTETTDAETTTGQAATAADPDPARTFLAADPLRRMSDTDTTEPRQPDHGMPTNLPPQPDYDSDYGR
jgi:hypothetical protein